MSEPKRDQPFLQQLCRLGHPGHHRPVPVRRTCRRSATPFPARRLPSTRWVARTRVRTAATSVASPAIDLDPVRSPCSARPFPPRQGPLCGPPGREPSAVLARRSRCDAPFASFIVYNIGLAIGDTRSLRPSGTKEPRAYARARTIAAPWLRTLAPNPGPGAVVHAVAGPTYLLVARLLRRREHADHAGDAGSAALRTIPVSGA